ncbi:acetyl-CoA C-acetyltransferase [Bacillus norwichensis]|uniref:acetyl-CoA C-acetyltransferase n=1 Tax=Bacillus norwichensis TaxID=2762217 RepID=A0ABR8VLD7_9BACI|nr:acetyl-CoA C-acetyltransferase [Bacillus norwichensis]MBD8005508.1 acetyl-CoA C-acetyltransferase [Bacillus norwichensis]
MISKEVVVLDGARTAFAEFCGPFREITAIDLAAETAREAMKRSGVKAEEVDQIVMGNVIQSSSDAIYMGRHVGLKAGIPEHVPGLTVNRLCGSGLQAIVNVAQSIQLGEVNIGIAGGAENMSQVPHVIRGARWGLRLGQTTMEDYLWEALYDPFGKCSMAMTAENLAEKYEITRDEIDEFALRSHNLALKAKDSGRFAEEIVPIKVKTRKGEQIVNQDEHPRETTKKDLSELPARFKEGGVVTAGNASGINDGAASLVVASSKYAERQHLKPLARLVSWGIVGVEPKYMGIGPVPAILQALEKANMNIGDLDLIEINEAFGAQYLACQKELGFDPAIGNVNGGAIALGHPLGASGARISLSLLSELKKRNKRFGASALCIGGGQGIAAIWESL